MVKSSSFDVCQLVTFLSRYVASNISSKMRSKQSLWFTLSLEIPFDHSISLRFTFVVNINVYVHFDLTPRFILNFPLATRLEAGAALAEVNFKSHSYHEHKTSNWRK